MAVEAGAAGVVAAIGYVSTVEEKGTINYYSPGQQSVLLLVLAPVQPTLSVATRKEAEGEGEVLVRLLARLAHLKERKQQPKLYSEESVPYSNS